MRGASVPLCVDCKHYTPDRGAGEYSHNIDHWCQLGIDVVTGEVRPVPCIETRSKEKIVFNQYGEHTIAQDACGYAGKFFEAKA